MNVLAVGCHPDDLEIACGGTLAKYVDQGADVYMCHAANGNMGHVEILPEPLAKLRAVESECAGEVLGVKKVFNLDIGDILVNRFDYEAVDALADVVRFVKPDVIITHNDMDYMQDHIETSRLVFNSSFIATLAHKSVKYAAFNEFVPIYFMDTLAGVDFIPTHYVDVTKQIDRKLQALACHESQIKWMMEHDGIDFLDMVRTCSRYRGYQCGVTYAEGYRPCTVYPRMTTKQLLP
ncbi:PIG-L deacetylase family protein [Robinsoniella sp.]|uniref:PIG-L deacetylase family protein n=1 Tax=Robinsoniella sp. TaxID=2496533 RepID=UPI003750400E